MGGALAGRRAIELTSGRGAYCGKLLADLGADVIKVEPPAGDPTRTLPPFWRDQPHPDGSLTFLYLNTSKRGVVLDLESEHDRRSFERLVATADVLIEDTRPGYLARRGLGYEDLRREHRELVVTSITAFGQTGPHCHWMGNDIVASARGGSMHVTGMPEDPPVVLAGHQTDVVASTCAAAATMIALHHAGETGEGQHVDISALEVMAAVTHICGVGKWLDDGIIANRFGTGLFASVPSGAYRCRDGLVYLMVNRPAHWQALARWVNEVTGNEEILDPMFEGPSSNRQPYRQLLDIFIGELTERFPAAHVYHEGQRRHLAITPVNRALDVVGDEHLRARGFFVPVEHEHTGRVSYPGAPYRLACTPWSVSRPAPHLGEHDDEVLGRETAVVRRATTARGSQPKDMGLQRPLAGLRVVELTAGMAGPWIGRFLAWCGAEVIKIESRKHPDVSRLYVPPRAPELGPQSQLSPWFTDWNAGKRFVALDLAKPEAVEIAIHIAGEADVVVENMSTGVLDKLGLGYERLAAAKPDLVMVSSTGYGASGPSCGYVTWGPNIEALSGSSALSGFEGSACTVTQYAYPDALSALHGLFAVLAALDHRRRTGQGQRIDVSQYEVTVAALGTVMLEASAMEREPRRMGNRSRGCAPQGCYVCKGEDRWCVVSVESEQEWRSLCRAIGRPDLAASPRLASTAERLALHDEIDEAIAAWTRARDPYEAVEVLQSAGVRAAVVQNVQDQVWRDRQLVERGFFECIEHEVLGRVLACGIPLGLTGTPGRTVDTGRPLGADNVYVLGRLLGLGEAEVAVLVDLGIVESDRAAGLAADD